MIVPDAAAWLAHLRARDERLVRHLAENRVMTCDVVVGALLLARGLPPELLRHLSLLPRIPSPSAAATGAFVERHRETLRAARARWEQAEVLLATLTAGATLHSGDDALQSAFRQLAQRADGSARSW